MINVLTRTEMKSTRNSNLRGGSSGSGSGSGDGGGYWEWEWFINELE